MSANYTNPGVAYAPQGRVAGISYPSIPNYAQINKIPSGKQKKIPKKQEAVIQSTRGIFDTLVAAWKSWWSPGPSQQLHPKVVSEEDQKFFDALKMAQERWNKMSRNRLVNFIKQNPDFETRLAEHLNEEQFMQIKTALEKQQKRIVQQQTLAPAFSSKEYVFPNDTSAIGWENPDLCGSGNEALWAGNNGSSQAIQILKSQSNAIVRNDTASTAISAQFPPRQGPNYFTIGCQNGLYHLFTSNGTATFHKKIDQLIYSVFEYLAHSTTITRDRSPIGVSNGNAAALILESSVNFLVSQTINGIFNRTYYILTPGNASQVPGIIGMADGSIRVIYPIANSLIERPFDALGSAGATKVIYNQQVSLIQFAKNPIPLGTTFTTGVSLDSLYTYNLINSTLKLSRSFAAPSLSVSIANCAPQNPDIHVIVKVVNTTGGIVTTVDAVDASQDSSSIMGGETDLPYPPMSSDPHSKVGCLSNLTALISIIDENGKPAYFQMNLVDPSTGPSPAASPSIAPLPGLLVINVNLPTSLNGTFVPITVEDISFSNNTAVMKITGYGDVVIVFPNASEVPLNSTFVPTDVYTFSWAKKNGTEGNTPPTVAVCRDLSQTDCVDSRPKSQIEQGTSLEGLSPVLIGIIVASAITAVGVGAAIFGIKVYWPHFREMRRKNMEMEAAKARRVERRKVGYDKAKATQEARTNRGNDDHKPYWKKKKEEAEAVNH